MVILYCLTARAENNQPGDSTKKAGADSSKYFFHFDPLQLRLHTPVELDGLQTPSIGLNKQGEKFVDEYLAKNSRMLKQIKEKHPSYFTIMDDVLTRYGLPTEVKYLAIIESQLNAKIVSPAGAAGAWQLMPVTARNFSLKVSAKNDERKHFYKSTVAAAKYLTYLYQKFDDWLLVIAAYNGGPGTVYKAIKKSGSRNFWKLQNYLPKETRDHVKRFISTHYYYEGEGSIATLSKEEVLTYREKMNTFVARQNAMLEEKQLNKIKSATDECPEEEQGSIVANNSVLLKTEEEK